MASAGAKMSKTASSFTQLTLSLPLPPFPLCLPSHVLSPKGYLALLNMIAQGSKSTHSKRTSLMCGHLPIKQASASIMLASVSLAKASQWPSPESMWEVDRGGEVGGIAG